MIAFLLLMSSVAPLPAKNPCMKDIHKYCESVIPGQGRLARCMEKHASLLSSGCKSFGEKYKKEHPEIAKVLQGGGRSG